MYLRWYRQHAGSCLQRVYFENILESYRINDPLGVRIVARIFYKGWLTWGTMGAAHFLLLPLTLMRAQLNLVKVRAQHDAGLATALE